MWAQYRKTLVPTQVFIVILCVCVFLFTASPLVGALILLAVMEICALIGAAWAARLHRKLGSLRDELPLAR